MRHCCCWTLCHHGADQAKNPEATLASNFLNRHATLVRRTSPGAIFYIWLLSVCALWSWMSLGAARQFIVSGAVAQVSRKALPPCGWKIRGPKPPA